ncbi:hypothetical protein KC356_g1943 [Hortaea werneckii]|nr:hypothetical protein KC356_g1943 [Hortaea werneckii]
MDELTEATETIRQERLAKSRQIWEATRQRAEVEIEKARAREAAQKMASQSKGSTHGASSEPDLGETDLPQTEDLQLDAAFADCENPMGEVTGRLRAKTLINLAMHYNQQIHKRDSDSESGLRQRLKHLVQKHNAASPKYTLRIVEAGAEVLVSSNNAKSLSTWDLLGAEPDEPMPDAVRACFESHSEDLDWIRYKPHDSVEYNEAKSSLKLDLDACLRTVAYEGLSPYWRQLVIDRAMMLWTLDSRANIVLKTVDQRAAELLGWDYVIKYGVSTYRKISMDRPPPATNTLQDTRTSNMQTPTNDPRIKEEPKEPWHFDEGEVINLITDESGGSEEDEFPHKPALTQHRLVNPILRSRSGNSENDEIPHMPAFRGRRLTKPLPRSRSGNRLDQSKLKTDESSGSEKDSPAKKRLKLLSKDRVKTVSNRGDLRNAFKSAENRRRAELRSNVAGPSAEAEDPFSSLTGSWNFPKDFSLGEKATQTTSPSQAPVAEDTDMLKAAKSEEPGTPGSDSNLRMPTPELPLDAGVAQTESTSQAPVVGNTQTIEATGSEEPGSLAPNPDLQAPPFRAPPWLRLDFKEDSEEEPTDSVSRYQATGQQRQDNEAMEIDDGNDGQSVVSASAEFPVDTPGLQGAAQHGDLNVNDDENEDTWENRYYEDAWTYFDLAKIHTKFMKQLDSLDKRICTALTPPSGMVVDTIRHFATRVGHPISSLEEIEEEYYGIDGWKEIASKLGPSTDYKDYRTTHDELEDAFLLKVARLAEDSKRPLKKILHQLRRDLKRCQEPFATLTELTSFLDNALRHAEAEPDAIYQQYMEMTNDLLCMREAYRNLRRGFTKYKCLAKNTREELASAFSKIQASYDGDWAALAEEGRDRHLASMADKILDPDNMHGLNEEFDYMDVWEAIGALMFFRQYQHLQVFIDQADECASYARNLFAVVDEEASAEADREEEAELQQRRPDLTQDNLRALADRQENQRQATDRRPDVVAEDEAPDVDLVDAAARAAMHNEDEDLEADELVADEGDDDGLGEPV